MRQDFGGRGRGEPQPRNVFGSGLQDCSLKPMTGFFRNGCCDTSLQDVGSHTVCVVMTDEFLTFSKAKGSDLSTPMSEFGFPGLKAGDCWCLCAARWKEALDAGHPPRIRLAATHEATLEIVPLATLKKFALDLS